MTLYKCMSITKGYKNYVTYDDLYNNYEINGVDNELKIAKKYFKNTKFKVNIDEPFEWDSPSIISNTIIEITNENSLNKNSEQIKLFSYLQILICKDIVIKISSFYKLKELKNLLELINQYNIHNVLLILNYNENYYSDDFGDIIMDDSVAKRKVLIFNSPFNKNFEDTMFFFKEKIKNNNFNKNISEFNSNRFIFLESQKHHTYFNRKLFIGSKGEIKNAPECNEEFGYIQNIKSFDDLVHIIEDSKFQKYWFVHKNICDVCKECEFRHMCVDNRLPYKRKENEWYHKVECNYNPFICKWKGDDGYLTLAECGVISNENEYTIDHEKIAKINKELWGEEE